jgi:PIN domain nuclease of toxin-antitoxin system
VVERGSPRLSKKALLLLSDPANTLLPLHHRDPFDRLLIAQATIENVPIVTASPEFRRYAIKVLW